jgi:hypothetical protein
MPDGEIDPATETPRDAARTDLPVAATVGDVVAGEEAWEESVHWAAEQLRKRREFEDAEAELTAAGWSAASASGIVEEARVRTREQRGVYTRDTARHAHARRTESVIVKSHGTFMDYVNDFVGMVGGWFTGRDPRRKKGEQRGFEVQPPPADRDGQ